MSLVVTNGNLQALIGLLTSLKDEHRLVGKCSTCTKYYCTHTVGGYEAGSAEWKTRAEGMLALESIIDQLQPPIQLPT